MDGATYDFIIIPIVMVPLLAGWLAMMYWADSHPGKFPRRTTVIAQPDVIAGQADTVHPAAAQVTVPRQATAPSKTKTSSLQGGNPA